MASGLAMKYLKLNGRNLLLGFLTASVFVMWFGLSQEYPAVVLKGNMTSCHTGSGHARSVSRFAGIQGRDDTTNTYAIQTKTSTGFKRNIADNSTAFWAHVASLATNRSLYPAEFGIDIVLHRLARVKVTEAQLFSQDDPDVNFGHTLAGGSVDYGSTHKWLLHLHGGQLVIFKPMW